MFSMPLSVCPTLCFPLVFTSLLSVSLICEINATLQTNYTSTKVKNTELNTLLYSLILYACL